MCDRLFSKTIAIIYHIVKSVSMIMIINTAVYAASPVLFYSDLVDGPKTGGYSNNGAFVTVWGKGFGASRGASKVTIGGGVAVTYPVWSDTKISFQLGANAQTGNIVVNTSEGSSNGLNFTINNAAIKFVNGSSGSGGAGTYDDPYRSPAGFIEYLESRGNYNGAILYFFGGSYNGNFGDTTWNDSTFMLTNEHKGSANNSVGFIAFPDQAVTITNSSGRPCFSLGKMSPGTSADYTTISQFILNHGNSEAVFGGGTDRNNEEGAVYMRVVGCDINANYGSANTMTGIVEVSGDWNYILGNDFENNAPSPINNNHAIYIQGGADHAHIGYNVFHRMKLGHVIQVHSDGGQGLVYEDIHVYSNIFTANNYNDTRGFNAGLMGDSSYGYVYNNLFYNIGQDFSAVCIYYGTWRIFNNTFYNIRARSSAYAACIVSDGGYAGDHSSPHAYVNNNIFYITDGASAYLLADNGPTFADIDTNIYYGNGNGPGNGLTDKHPRNVDPEFVAPQSGNFNLQDDSLAINAGIPQNLFVMEPDLNGVIKTPSMSLDIGALEHSGDNGGLVPQQPPDAPKNFRVE